MNNFATPRAERLFLIVDDDPHSARFFRQRIIAATGRSTIIRVDWFESADGGLLAIESLQDQDRQQVRRLPDLIIIDLKASSMANMEFLTKAEPSIKALPVPSTVFAKQAGKAKQSAYLKAGAAAIFERHADLEQYDAELARMITLSELSKAA